MFLDQSFYEHTSGLADPCAARPCILLAKGSDRLYTKELESAVSHDQSCPATLLPDLPCNRPRDELPPFGSLPPQGAPPSAAA